ncbi:MAG: putative sulfate exporter family transporter [Flavobacteriales bacterium]|nr:putative sulfate exporter family transporter [Flavobacteriales bacterium]
MKFTGEQIKGIIAVVLLGTFAFFTAPYIPLDINNILFGLMLGVLLGNLFTLPEILKPGVGYAAPKMLEGSIIMLAFGIHFSAFAEAGALPVLLITGALVAVLLITVLLSKVLKCPGTTGLLTGFGTAICGSSAIAAAAPGISENKEDAGIALAVVNLMGALGMVILPAILPWISLSDEGRGFLIGGSLHAVGNVAGAGYALNDTVGQTAVAVKMIRVALLSPMVIFFNILVNRKSSKNWKEYFKLPPYLWVFIGLVIFSSLVDLPKALITFADSAGKYLLTLAMVAIGLQLSFKRLYTSGRSALGFGVVIFIVQILLFILILPFSGFSK